MSSPPLIQQPNLTLQTLDLFLLHVLLIFRLQREPEIVDDLIRKESKCEALGECPAVGFVEGGAWCFGVDVVIVLVVEMRMS